MLPAALVFAVTSALLGGGLGGLGAVSQIVTGPQVPEASLEGGSLPKRAVNAPPTVPARLPVAPRAAVAAPTVGPQAPAPAATSPSPTAGVPAPRPGAAAPATPAAQQPGAPAPNPRPANPVRQAGEQVAGTAGTLPAPAGPAGADAVTTVLDIVAPPPTVRRLLDH